MTFRLHTIAPLRRLTDALAQLDNGHARRPVSARLLWGLLFVSLMAVRLRLPFISSDLAVVHQAITDSLTAGQNWGRQALMGTLEFPPLPTLALLTAQHVPLVPEKLATSFLVAFAQAWTFCYILRLADRKRDRVWIALCAVAVGLVPVFRVPLLTLDPNWIAAVPVAAAGYHTVRWIRSRELRDALLAAICAGILAFAGPDGIGVGFALLVAMRFALSTLLADIPAADRRGAALLLWAPFSYAVVLLFIGNWLILGNPVFFLRRLVLAAAGAGPAYGLGGPGAAFRGVPYPALVTAFGGVASVVAAARPRRTRPELALLAMLCTLAGCRLALEPIHFLAPGLEGLFFTVTVMTLSVGLVRDDRVRCSRIRRSLPWAVAILAIVFGTGQRFTAQTGAEFRATAPYARGLTGFVDRFWRNSRILVYGIRAPVCYPDVREKRFLPRLDFRKNVLLEQARQEQLYLLVPPDNGVFYPSGTGVLADLHRNGRPWLLLERTWPPGWQLWRCVIPPKHESRLHFLDPAPRGRRTQ